MSATIIASPHSDGTQLHPPNTDAAIDANEKNYGKGQCINYKTGDLMRLWVTVSQ